MSMTASPFARSFAVAALLGGLAFASPSFAASPMADQQMDMSSSAGGKKAPGDMAQRVETRIKTLHDKLQITPDQESAWNDVAQSMRDNEANMHDVIEARHANASKMTAIDDLQSYQKIAQAHADGMGKLISSFSSLYDSMSPEQQKNADQVFGSFEGHRGMAKASAHKKGSGASISKPDAE